MKPVILDSSALFSLASEADMNHAQALDIAGHMADEQRMMVLPTEIFAELLNIAGKRLCPEASVI